MIQRAHIWRLFPSVLLLLLTIGNDPVSAQEKDKGFKMSLQTDLLAYTTAGGWSAWLALQHRQNKLSLAYINFPNRYANDYEDTGIQENDRFVRIQFARYFSPDTKMKNFFYGVNLQYHFRELVEDNNPSIWEGDAMKIAPIFGYEWHPLGRKENALKNLSLVLWVGPAFLFGGYEQEIILPETGSIYPARDRIEGSAGVLLSYTIF